MKVFYFYTAIVYISGSSCLYIPERTSLVDGLPQTRRTKFKKNGANLNDSKWNIYVRFETDERSNEIAKKQSNLFHAAENFKNMDEMQEKHKKTNLNVQKMFHDLNRRRKRSTFDSISQSTGFEGFSSNDRVQRNIRRLRRLQRLQNQQRRRNNRAPYAIEIVMPILHRRVNEPAIRDIIIEV